MNFPKLSMRDVRRHPAVITDGDNLKEGMEVATCYLLSPIGRVGRCAQALMSLVPSDAAEKQYVKKREAMREGYRHTQTWGIVMQNVATIDWVNRGNTMSPHPYMLLKVGRSSIGMSIDKALEYRATDVDSLSQLATVLPEVDIEDRFSGGRIKFYERIVGFEKLGLTKDPQNLQQFVVDLSKLA